MTYTPAQEATSYESSRQHYSEDRGLVQSACYVSSHSQCTYEMNDTDQCVFSYEGAVYYVPGCHINAMFRKDVTIQYKQSADGISTSAWKLRGVINSLGNRVYKSWVRQRKMCNAVRTRQSLQTRPTKRIKFGYTRKAPPIFRSKKDDKEGES